MKLLAFARDPAHVDGLDPQPSRHVLSVTLCVDGIFYTCCSCGLTLETCGALSVCPMADAEAHSVDVIRRDAEDLTATRVRWLVHSARATEHLRDALAAERR